MSTSSPVPSDALALGGVSATGADLRARLGLRPLTYSGVGPHPDHRPCPPWCWVAQSEGDQQHELIANHPMKALHHIADPVRIVASLYPGEAIPDLAGRHVRTATLELDLTQLGSADPTVTIHLHPEQSRHRRHLTLTLLDARELAAVLTHLVDLATRTR